MALTDDGGMVLPVAPMNNGGMGNFGGDWGWIILLLLFAGGGFGGFGGMDMYPWLNQSNQMQAGFTGQMLNTSVDGIQNAVTSGFGNVQTALCGGFAGVNATVNNAQNGITSQMYNNTIADLERSFAAQTANTAGLTNLSQQLSQCCCNNNLATVQTQNIVQSEGAATRLAIQNQTQQILDKLCEQEIEQLRSQNVSLQNQVNMLNLAASQTAQTQYLVDRLAPTTVI